MLLIIGTWTCALSGQDKMSKILGGSEALSIPCSWHCLLRTFPGSSLLTYPDDVLLHVVSGSRRAAQRNCHASASPNTQALTIRRDIARSLKAQRTTARLRHPYWDLNRYGVRPSHKRTNRCLLVTLRSRKDCADQHTMRIGGEVRLSLYTYNVCNILRLLTMTRRKLCQEIFLLINGTVVECQLVMMTIVSICTWLRCQTRWVKSFSGTKPDY